MKRLAALFVAAAIVIAALLPALRTPGVNADAPQSPLLQTGSAVRSACTAAITETAAPDHLLLCETSGVTVTAAITCPPRLPVHLVIVIDRSKSMADTSEPVSNRILQDVKRSARNVIEALDWDIPGTMVGVVSHGFRITTQSELTATKSRAIGAVNSVRYDSGDLGEDPGKAIARAQQLLEAEREGVAPLEVIVLYGDGCDPTVSGCEVSSRRAAAKAAGDDIRVMSVCYKESDRADCPDYQALASEPRYYFENGNRVPNTVEQVQDEGEGSFVESSQLIEMLSADVTYEPDTGAPAPAVEDSQLTFSFGATQPGQAVTASYRVGVLTLGQLPIRTADSALTLVDSLGRVSDPIPVPMRPITVTGPCIDATPTPTATTPPTAVPTAVATETPDETATPVSSPTDTATDVPPTAEATPTGQPSFVFLPLALRDACKPAEVHTNVVLAIDASTSMDQMAGEATKLEAAKHAASTFVGMLQLDEDYAGVVAFNSEAALLTRLTQDESRLHAAIDGTESQQGTRIDLALDMSLQVLRDGPQVGVGNNEVVVLLTDGRTDEGTADPAIGTADELKRSGIVIYSIGLGADVDPQFLTTIASSPDTYLKAPTAADLEEIYREIAGMLPCPGGAFWPIR
jgi:Mg-chelatase subunit ChlD